jgi:hypothetical protein
VVRKCEKINDGNHDASINETQITLSRISIKQMHQKMKEMIFQAA